MAIALLPLKEGETLASNIGRYAEIMKLNSTFGLRQSLFGYCHYRGGRLPSSIDFLAEQTRDYWNLKSEDIINWHTEFRYLTMMAPKSIREMIFKRMQGSSEGSVRAIVVGGLNGERAPIFRYCEECLKGDIENHQTPYWRIDHQLAGVYYCIKHSCVLRSVRKVPGRYVDQTLVRHIHASDKMALHGIILKEKMAILDVSRRSVRQRESGYFGKSARQYQDLLREVGLLRENSTLRHVQLISAWFDYFGEEYCYLTNTNSNRISMWLNHLSRGIWGCECPHPFMFIAGESLLEHLAELPGSYFPRKLHKDSCLLSEEGNPNPSLDAYTCKGALHRNSDFFKFTSPKPGRWKLACTCGLTYLLAPQCDAKQLKPCSYGARYRRRFSALIGKGMYICDAARELHVSASAARQWIGREGVPARETMPKEEVERLRERWCLLVKNMVSKSRITSAAVVDPVTYKALKKCDGDWLYTFNRLHRSPPRAKNSFHGREPTVDKIRAAQRGLIMAEPPTIASRSAILERVGFPRACNRSRPYWAALVEATECRLTYLERVISWLTTLALRQRLGDCDEALRSAGLRRERFNGEQRERIRKIELMNAATESSAQKR
ncbi:MULTISPECIES: TniQ family protein [unclassified Paraburkholderia]|uniref:TniQ family protein n=1 Tax=unclassified Paraburkholderia TaxID=2615204 RepID=UPI002AB165E8|nr:MULTISPECIES: TniQ family protein [unclassified Paraburkholderia]